MTSSYRKIYLTGDECVCDSNGNIFFLKREDAQVKVGGIRVELGEIEATISSCKRVSSCAVSHEGGLLNGILWYLFLLFLTLRSFYCAMHCGKVCRKFHECTHTGIL